MVVQIDCRVSCKAARPGNQVEDGMLIARTEQDPRTWDDEAQVLGSLHEI